MACAAAEDLPFLLDLGSGVEAAAGGVFGAGAALVFAAGTDLVAAGFWATGFFGETLATGVFDFVGLAGAGFWATGAFFAGEDLAAGFETLAAGFEGLATFTGAFLAGAGFLATGLGAGFLTGLAGAFFAAGFFAGEGFLGAGAFLAGFVLEMEREELFGEDLDLVFKRLSFKSFTLGQKADEDRPCEFSGQGFVFGFFGAPRGEGWNRPRGS